MVKIFFILAILNIGLTKGVENSKKAILITGGYNSAKQSAEVFLPWSNTTCRLPSLPDERNYHVQSGNTLCGGGRDSSTRRSCIQWRQDGWVTMPVTLTKERYASSAWGTEEGLVIMGGSASKKTSERVSNDGANTVNSFRMKGRLNKGTMYACSISLGDEVVLTGGFRDATYFGEYGRVVPRVARYNRDGFVETMPSLRTGRYNHGCTSFISGEDQVLLVTGGEDYYNRHDSTEILKLSWLNPGSSWQELRSSARLPRPRSSVSVTTVDNRVLLFGGSDGKHGSGSDILEYTDGEGWRELGTMKSSRSDHATSVVAFDQMKNHCN